MKTLVNKVSGLDKVDKFGVAFGVLFLLPCLTVIMIDVIVNGANML